MLWRNKPISTVSYSGGTAAGVRAIEHLALIAIETDAVPLRNTVIIPQVTEAFDELGEPKNLLTNISLDVLLEDLAWWSSALETARAAGELPPGIFRSQAAMAKAQSSESIDEDV